MHSLSFKVYPNQCDPNGHLNTQFFVQAFDSAAWELVTALDTATGEGNAAGWADVRTTIEYHTELRAGTRAQVNSWITRFGRTSMHLHHEMSRVDDGHLIATMDSVSVRIDLMTRRPISIPAEFITAASARQLMGES